MVAEWWAHRTFMALAQQSIWWELEVISAPLDAEELMTDAAPRSVQAVLFDPEAGDRRRTVMAALAQLEQGQPYEHALLGWFADRDHMDLVMEALELGADPADSPVCGTPHAAWQVEAAQLLRAIAGAWRALDPAQDTPYALPCSVAGSARRLPGAAGRDGGVTPYWRPDCLRGLAGRS